MVNRKGAKKSKKSPARTSNEGLNTLNQRKITQSFRARNEEEEIEFSKDNKTANEQTEEEHQTNEHEPNEVEQAYKNTDHSDTGKPPGKANEENPKDANNKTTTHQSWLEFSKHRHTKWSQALMLLYLGKRR